MEYVKFVNCIDLEDEEIYEIECKTYNYSIIGQYKECGIPYIKVISSSINSLQIGERFYLNLELRERMLYETYIIKLN